MEQLKLDIEDNVVTEFTMTPHLANRMRQILSILRDRDWITVEELCELSGYDKQMSISALCRDLRKESMVVIKLSEGTIKIKYTNIGS